MQRVSIVNPFVYTDYREFLRDWYKKAKAECHFSFRVFSKRAGFTSPNFFKLVMDGERNLTEESLGKFVQGLGLNKQESEFFRNLVFFTQAKNHEERDHFYRLLLQSRKYNELKPIEKHQYEYCAEWYHAVIRELVTSPESDGTPEWIAEKLFPHVSVDEVRRSINLLARLGFIERREDGGWMQTTSILSTGAEVASVALLNYHKRLLDLAKEILESAPASQRDISSLTLGIPEDAVPMLKKKIQEFRQEILKLVSTAGETKDVVQLNIQLLPVTRGKEK